MSRMMDFMFDVSTWPAGVPSPLAEAGNGIAMPLMLMVLMGLVVYVVEQWTFVRHSYEHVWSWRPIVTTYQQRKAAIALFVGVAGVEIKTSTVWLSRHLTNHGVDPSHILSPGFGPIAYISGTLAMIIGFGCWLRVTLPDRIKNATIIIGGREIRTGRLALPMATLGCIWWGTWMAT